MNQTNGAFRTCASCLKIDFLPTTVDIHYETVSLIFPLSNFSNTKVVVRYLPDKRFRT